MSRGPPHPFDTNFLEMPPNQAGRSRCLAQATDKLVHHAQGAQDHVDNVYSGGDLVQSRVLELIAHVAIDDDAVNPNGKGYGVAAARGKELRACVLCLLLIICLNTCALKQLRLNERWSISDSVHLSGHRHLLYRRRLRGSRLSRL